MGFNGASLPDFPWDSLTHAREVASAHPGGIVDLSVGTPVDPTPQIAQDALIAAADAPGYPTAVGTPQLRDAIARWFGRRRSATVTSAQVLPTIGSKEMVAYLPSLLGLGESDVVVHPAIAYPTYDVGARLAGATPFPSDDLSEWPAATRLIWLNSPGNPHGHVLSVEQLREIVQWARENGAIVAADECYAELSWEEPWTSEGVPSLLDDRVTDGDHRGLLVAYSLSKQSNLAGYRAAFLAGDQELIAQITEIRKHSGMLVPAPVQAAMTVLLDDDQHVREQKALYRERRSMLLPAVRDAGLVPDEANVAGLYVWAKADAPSSDRIMALAKRGILAAPGTFYGPAADGYVRMALTASTERIAAAAERLQGNRLEF